MSSRRIFKGKMRAESEVANLLQSILAAELVAPSSELWLVSPWISDIPVIDNRSAGFSTIEPSWGRRLVLLSEALSTLIKRGTRVVVATRPDEHNDRFLYALRTAAASAGLSERLLVHQDGREALHEKGLLGEDYFVSGSMNFTESGIRLNDEALTFEMDESAVAHARLHFRQHYGGPAA
jgi:hypothetical protein